MGRQREVTFSTSQHKIKGLLDLIHMDVWGLSPTTFIRCAKYYVMIIDDFSRRIWVYFLKKISEIFQNFKK